MSQTIVLGSAARCTDGKGGSISQIVVNPKTNALEYVIVHRGIFGGHDHCVPAGDIHDAGIEGVTLTIRADELKALYEGKGITPDKHVIAYCRIGERSSHSWFVLKYLLGYPSVSNYDGSWTEWGNMIGNPIEK